MNIHFWKNWRLIQEATLIQYATRMLSEFFGTAILLFLGCMSCTFGRFDALIEAVFGFGFAFLIAMQSFRHISGAHINPLLTIAGLVLGYIPLVDALLYFVSQFLGAMFGFGLIRFLVDESYIYGPEVQRDTNPGICSPVINPEITKPQAIVMEFIISFSLVMSICSAWDHRNKYSLDSMPVRFGLTIAGLAIVAEPYTGGNMNPARTLAPALLNNYWKHFHLYWLGQLSGALTASLIYAIIFDIRHLEEGEENKEGTASPPYVAP